MTTSPAQGPGSAGRAASPQGGRRSRLGSAVRERSLAGRRAPSILDWALASVLLLVGLLEVAGGVFPGPVGVAAVIEAAMIVPVAFRCVAPVRAIAVSAVASLPFLFAYGVEVSAGGSVANAAVGLLLIYSVGRHADGRRLLAGIAVILLMTAEQGVGRPATPSDDAIVFFLSAAVLGLGVALRHQVERSTSLALAADRARHEQAAALRVAVDTERARIARELHDVVAHNIGLIVLQAGGARTVLATDPDRARAAVVQVEEMGRQTLAEMRHLVGVLRVGEGSSRQPLPRLDRLPALVEEARAAGIPVDLEIEGTAFDLPAGLELAAYRIVQEALTNVRIHAPRSSARVRLRYEPDRLAHRRE